MKLRYLRAMAAGLALAASAGAASAAACKLQEAAEYPVAVVHNRPLIEVSINGQPARLIMDLGASKTMLFTSGAQKLGLQIAHASVDGDATFYGVGGDAAVGSVRIQEFKLGAYKVSNFDLFAMRDHSEADNAVGVLGEDFFGDFDLELDLPHQRAALFKPQGCSGDEVVYWPGNYSVVHMTGNGNLILAEVQLNGVTTYAMMDSGSPISYVTTEAARRAGVTPQSPGARDGHVTGGIGHEAVAIKIANFKTFAMGQETVNNIALPLGNLFGADKTVKTGSRIATDAVDNLPEMLIGLDFMKAHRIYVARGQQKVYFTYVGGPVFANPALAAPAPAPKP